MTSSPTNRIRIDPGQVQSLAVKVSAVRSDLISSKDVFDFDEALHSSVIERALHDFNNAWSQRRGQLVKLLNGAETMLHAAADQFCQEDAALAAGLGDSGEHMSNNPTY